MSDPFTGGQPRHPLSEQERKAEVFEDEGLLADLTDRELREKAAASGLEIEVSDEPISQEEALKAAKLVSASSIPNPLVPTSDPSLERRREAVKELVIKTALSEVEEQAIRDHYRYTSSEKRTKQERDTAAARMLRRAGLEAGGITEESYVEEQLALTREYIRVLKPLVRAPQDPPSVVDKTSPQAIRERLERAEKYARWRYRGFVEGEIASL
jgi:hypothetical protein